MARRRHVKGSRWGVHSKHFWGETYKLTQQRTCRLNACTNQFNFFFEFGTLFRVGLGLDVMCGLACGEKEAKLMGWRHLGLAVWQRQAGEEHLLATHTHGVSSRTAGDSSKEANAAYADSSRAFCRISQAYDTVSGIHASAFACFKK